MTRTAVVVRRVVVPLAVAAGALAAFAAGEGTLSGDVEVARAVQRAVLPWARGAVEALNRVGETFPGTVVAGLLAVLLLLRAGCRAEALLVALTLPLRLLNGGLKRLFDSPRPTDEAVRVLERADGLGFPSGHASSAVLFYGALFAVVPCLTRAPAARWLLRAACLAMIVLVGIARVAVGAHWPSDVVGGYLWGGLLLAILLLGFRRGLEDGRTKARDRRVGKLGDAAATGPR